MTGQLSLLRKQLELGDDSTRKLQPIRLNKDAVTLPHGDSMADELAAMANTASGVILLGVDDKTRAIVGIPLDKIDLIERWVQSLCHDRIEPPLECLIHKLFVNDQHNQERAIIRIDVPRSLFVHKSPNGYFQRIGSSKREMKPDALARLFQQRSQARLIRFDDHAVPKSGLSSLSPKLWNRFRTSLSPRAEEEFLQKLKLLVKTDDGTLQATVGDLLLASETPEAFLTSAFIQAVRYRGNDRNAAHQLDPKDITGPLGEQVQKACKFVQQNMRVNAVKAQGRIETPQYSLNAVFEAVVNAVAHRDDSIYGSKIRRHVFSDRLELYSPGTIPNTMTLESLSERQSARNELITSLLARCPMNFEAPQSQRRFLMDKRGEGVPIILTESEALSGRRPRYDLIDDAELKLTIFAAPSPHGED